MSIESFKEKIEEKEEKKEEPIADIELSPDNLEEWEKLGLDGEVGDLVLSFDELVPQGEKFALHTANFESTSRFMEKTESEFDQFEAKNEKQKIKEVEDFVRKAILNFAFKELEIDAKTAKPIKEETIEEKVYPVKSGEAGAAEQQFNGARKITYKYFATNQPDTFLVFDGIDWYLQKR